VRSSSKYQASIAAWVAVILVAAGLHASVSPPPSAVGSSLVLTFEEPNDDVVLLGDLASRTQRKTITVGGSSAPFTITGTDSRGGSYRYLTDVTTSTGRESDERGFGSFSFTSPDSASFSGRSNPMYLKSNGNCNAGNTFDGLTTFCAVFGPEVWTEPFAASAGQALSFDYAAQASDNYEVYAFLVEVSASGETYDYGGGKAENSTDPLDTHTLILHRRGKSADWTTASGSVPKTAQYRFRFVDGAYDNSGGYALGTDFYIDESSVTVGNGQVITFTSPGDQVGASGTFDLVASSSSGQTVTFSSSTTAKCTVSGATVTKLATGTCTITADAAGGDVSGTTYVAASSVTNSFDILASATAPTNTGVPTIFGTVSAGTTLTSDEGTWNTGGAAITSTTYQWVATASGVDENIAGATEASFCVPEELEGSTLKLEVTKTNSEGSTSAASVATSAVSAGTNCPEPPAEESGPRGGSSPAPAAAPEPSEPPTVPSQRATEPPRVLNLSPRPGPVLRAGRGPIPPAVPTATVGNRAVATVTSVPAPNQLDVRLGALSVAVDVASADGRILRDSDGSTEIRVNQGGDARVSGSGFRPGATVQLFLPLAGANAKEIARVPVAEDGSFDGSAPFATRSTDPPLPIGKTSLQLVSLDDNGDEVVVEMTVNIAQGAPAPEANRIEGTIPTLQPGQSIATSGGEPTPITITPVSDQKLAVVEGDGWTMSVNVASEQGGVERAAEGALLKLVRNESALVSGSGFMPGTRADVWLFSDPTLLGTVTIDENGAFTGEVNVDASFVAVGEHTLQLQGVGEDGYVKAANLGVVVEEPVSLTGEGAGTLLWWVLAALLAAAVVIALIIARARSRVSG